MTPYQQLANAIIMQAVKDYRMTRNENDQNEILDFFRSDWFSILCNLDGAALIAQLQKEAVRR